MKKIIMLAVALLTGSLFAQSEGHVQGSLRIKKDSFSYSQNFAGVSFGVDSTLSDQGVLLVTAARTNDFPLVTNTIPIANVVTPHYAVFNNISDNSNTVFVTVTMRLEVGDIAIFPTSSTVFPVWSTNAFGTNQSASFQYGVFSK